MNLPIALALALLAPALSSEVNPIDEGAKCDGRTDDTAALVAAATRAAAQSAGVVVTCQILIGRSAGTIAAAVRFDAGGSLDLRPGGALTLTGPLDAGLRPIFRPSGGTLDFKAKVKEV